MQNITKYAPIVLFVYNRVEHTKKTIDALLKNPESKQSSLFIYSDAPKHAEDTEDVEKLRKYISAIDGFGEIIVVHREKNWGLANSVIDGVSQLIRKYGRVIVLEDDLVVTSGFLSYMNKTLEIFKNNQNIAAVSGYMLPIKNEYGNKLFLRSSPLSWGWATWERAWVNFNPDSKELLKKLQKARKLTKFNLTGPLPYTTMLKRQIAGKNNSWFVRWAAYLVLNDMMTVMPTQSLVKNIGIDGTGTHCAEWRFNPYHIDLDTTTIEMDMLDAAQSAKIENRLKLYFMKIRFLRYVNYIYRLVKR